MEAISFPAGASKQLILDKIQEPRVAVQRMRVIFDLTDHEIKPRFVDGRELPAWEKGLGMVDYVKRLESEGWQVVGGKGNNVVFERKTP